MAKTWVKFTRKGKKYEKTPGGLECPKCKQTVDGLLGEGDNTACEECWKPVTVAPGDKPKEVPYVPQPQGNVGLDEVVVSGNEVKDSAGLVVGEDVIEEDPELTSFKSSIQGQAQKGGE